MNPTNPSSETRSQESGVKLIRAAGASLGRISAVLMGLMMLAGCGGSSSGSGTTPPPPTPTVNTVDVAVNSGPASNAINLAFVSVNVCNPGGQTTCATIPNVQVDTGSSGLRILASAPGVSNLALTPVTGGGSSVYECFLYSDGSYLWGQVEQADVSMAGENATHVPIQVVSTSSAPSNTPCGAGGGSNLNTPTLLQANGVLGLGTAQQDCGMQCTGSSVLPDYWLCSSASSCSSVAAVPTATQVSNPVIFFTGDNNGVSLTLSQVVAGGAATSTGTLTFGIGTQSDNALSSTAKAYGLSLQAIGGQPYPAISAIYPAGTGSTYPALVDSGETLNYFLDAATVAAAAGGAGISNCLAENGLYCTNSISPINLAFTTKDSSGDSASASLSVADGVTLLNSSVQKGGGNTAFNSLTGGGATATNDFVILGMPFFYGKTVYLGIAGQVPPTGVPSSFAADGYWAF